jgi:restriction system protein
VSKSKDSIESKPRKATERKQLYQNIVASLALRTIHEVLEADAADALKLVTFTGIVDTTDPANGRPIRVPVISVRAPKADFFEILLDRVDKAACLKNLGAKVSARPDELQAVKPIVEFDMVDRRFVEQGDALAGLESRPNLMELTPTEFEVLVANLFGKMGLESKLTRASRDGGVDAIAYDARPVLGGKVVIQAKRYRNTVGVEAVRDLYGTMLNEGANKGILVTTSGYGPDAYNFSKDKPVELIDGGGLLYLLREHAGVNARISI